MQELKWKRLTSRNFTVAMVVRRWISISSWNATTFKLICRECNRWKTADETDCWDIAKMLKVGW